MCRPRHLVAILSHLRGAQLSGTGVARLWLPGMAREDHQIGLVRLQPIGILLQGVGNGVSMSNGLCQAAGCTEPISILRATYKPSNKVQRACRDSRLRFVRRWSTAMPMVGASLAGMPASCGTEGSVGAG
jgi:hypothetical protein